MKTKKIISTVFASLLMMVLSITVNAQSKTDSLKMKDCCMMKDGKMCCVKDGKTMPMDKDMTMKNGAKCMVNGECIMKDGKKMKMKEGECMDMNGKMGKCDMMHEKHKGENKTSTYTCSMHPEVTSDKPGKCSKCGMELIKKK